MLWSETLPNWATALISLVALVLAAFGAHTAWRSMQSQLRRDAEESERRRRARARTVTARWVWRKRQREGEDEIVEFGLLVTNHGPTTVLGVAIEAIALGTPCEIQELPALHPGDAFIRKKYKQSFDQFDVMRMSEDVAAVETIYREGWQVTSLTFWLDGERLTWSNHRRPVRGE